MTQAIKLRRWQSEALKAQCEAIERGEKNFFVAAGVASGKTTQALALYQTGRFDKIVVVTPKTGIRRSWNDDAKPMGIKFLTISAKELMDDCRTEDGLVMTASMVPSVADKVHAYCKKYRVLLVLDEAHHYGENMAWAESVIDAFSCAAFMLALSGTPFRADERQILGLTYSKAGDLGYAAPQFVYPYERALADGHVPPVITRFVGGRVEQNFPDGTIKTYDYQDGDYAELNCFHPDKRRMGARIRLTAVECHEWQHAAIKLAREELMLMRNDGHPWGGLIACKTLEQAKELTEHLETAYGDKVLNITGDADTEDAVAMLNADTSIDWAVTITKISEGCSIPRLRVGLMLTNITSKTMFDQFRGRLGRLYRGIGQLDQPAVLFVPADPRLIDHAVSLNTISLHSVPWLSEDATPEAYANSNEAVSSLDADYQSNVVQQGDLDAVRAAISGSGTLPIIDLGSYRVRGWAEMQGAAIGGKYIPEDKVVVRMRRSLARVISPVAAKSRKPSTIRYLHAMMECI